MNFYKKAIAFIVLISTLSQTTLATAAPVCSKVFSWNLDKQLISEIQIISDPQIKQQVEKFIIENKIQEIDFYNLKHLQYIIAKKLRTAAALDSLNRRLEKSIEFRANESIEWAMAEKIILQGSIKYFEKNISDKSSYNRTISFVQAMSSSKFANLLGLPFSLPTIQNKEVPEQLHQNILLYGIEKNRDTILSWYKQQNIREGYQTIERIYAPIGISILIYYVLITHQEKELEKKIQVNQEYEDFRIEQNKSNTAINQLVNSEIDSLQTLRLKEFIRLYELQYNKMPSLETLHEAKLLIQQSTIK